jgi:serine/threonine-protein kinase
VVRGSAHTPAYVAGSGHLLYAQEGGGLVALPFDPAAGKQAGGAFPLLERIDIAHSDGSGLALSASGTLAYLPARSEMPQRALVLVDRQGVATPIGDAPGAYSHPRAAADGSKVAVAIESETGTDIWVHDLQRGTRTRLTGGGSNRFPVWSGRGTQLAFQATASPGRFSLFSRDAAGSGQPVPLLGTATGSAALQAGTAGLLPGSMPQPGSANPHVPVSWSADGRHLAFAERKPGAQRDIWVLPSDADPAPFVLTPFDEWSPAFSPNGEWLAYVSNESGRNEIYVQPYPGPGGKWLISTDGGTEPAWSHDGKELFYRRNGQMFAVSVQNTPAFSASRPRLLFEGPFATSDASRNYDVLPDGRFLMVRDDLVEMPRRLYVAMNWLEQLRARAAGGK